MAKHPFDLGEFDQRLMGEFKSPLQAIHDYRAEQMALAQDRTIAAAAMARAEKLAHGRMESELFDASRALLEDISTDLYQIARDIAQQIAADTIAHAFHDMRLEQIGKHRDERVFRDMIDVRVSCKCLHCGARTQAGVMDR